MLGQLLGIAGQVATASVSTATRLGSALLSEATQLAAAVATPRVCSATDKYGAPMGRASIAVRGAHLPANQPAVQRLAELLAERDGIHRVETNGVHGRIALNYAHEQWDPETLSQLVAEIEEICGLADQPWAPTRGDHPAHPETMLRTAVGFGLNIAGLGYATIARAVPIPPLGGLSVTLSMLDAVPRLRALLEDRLGPQVTDLLLSTAAAASNTATRQPLALIADTCQRYLLYQEARARRRCWLEWDRALADREGSQQADPIGVPPRPVPLPNGVAERTAHRSALVAGLTTGVALFSPLRSRAQGVLTAGVPKAARTTREGFAAQLDRDMSAAGVLVLETSALRRLDRVDTVLLDAEVLLTGRQVIDAVLPINSDSRDDTDGPCRSDSIDQAELFTRAHDLVDPRQPRQHRRSKGWSVTLAEPDKLNKAARRLAQEHIERGETVLVLHRGTRPVALVTVVAELDPLAEALVKAARDAGSVLVFAPGGALGHRLGVDGVLAAHGEPDDDREAGLLATVSRLQQQGRVVALVARSASTALAASDVGIGLADTPSAPPWGAHVLSRDPAQACRLLSAVPLARRASRHGAWLALVGSALGGLLGVLGPAPGAGRRAGIGVHTAALLGLGAGVWAAMSAARLPVPVPTERTPWHAMSSQAVLRTLNSSPEGLPEAEAERRRRSQPARRTEQQLGLGRAAMEELATPLTPALAVGAGISASAGSILDPLLITTVLVVNALIGGVQRLGAQRELRRLTARAASKVRIRRATNGQAHTTARADQLAVGDVIELQAGDAVPADCRLISARNLEVDESSLTGESTTVAKTSEASAAPAVADRTSMLYEGTVVATGRAVGVVVATGARTEIGRTQRLGTGEAPASGVEARLRTLTTRVLPASLVAGLLLAAVDLMRGRRLGHTLSRSVGLAVAAVPEGLPFVATVAELAAARRLSARGTLVRNPSTIEALGRVDVLCFDKTGTLTEGRLGLRRVSDGTRHAPLDQLTDELRAVLAAAVRACPFATKPRQVPHQTDRAVLRDAARFGVTEAYDHDQVEQLHELAFESGRGYHATLWRGGEGTHLSVKGAPEVVLPLAGHWQRSGGRIEPLDERARDEIGAEVERLARQGYRVLAVAERPAPGLAEITEADVTGLRFRGLLALADPIRATAAQAVATLRSAGVKIVMITGDHPSTAESIAAELDSLNGRQVLTGADLDALDDEQLTARLSQIAVFARVTPEQKARIVRLLRAAGHVVAVTGDGANDAPAIRLADVGLALGERATSAAREAADVVITDDRIETIADAIVEGRGMWSSVRDALSILLGGNLGEIAYTVATGLFNGADALNARQLLLINMLTDVLPAMAIAVRPPPDVSPEELLAEGPEVSLGGALTRDITLRAAITAIAASAAWVLARPASSPGQASTTGLVALVGAQLGQTVAVRGRTPLVVAAAVGSLLALAVIVQVPGVSHVAGCRPLLPHQWGIALAAAGAASLAQLFAPKVGRIVTSWLPLVIALLARRSPAGA